MSLIFAIISGYLIAPITPWLHRRLGDRVGYLIAVLPFALLIYFLQFLGTVSESNVHEVVREWSPTLGISISLRLDGLSLLMCLLISAVGGLVSIYATGYLHGNSHMGAFFACMSCFMASMLGLVVAGNLLLLYVFWELTTITSFLLIGFEHEKADARAAALKSLMVTSLGGLAMLAGILLLGHVAGTYDFRELIAQGDMLRSHPLYPAILVLILTGAFAKSAQFPFHFWLPAAMEAPAPVSAYLHSATMVKAGIYLLARLTPALGGTELWTGIVTTIGAITMVIGAWMALFDPDLKGVLAKLTINVLGTLVMLLGIGTDAALKAAMVYLVAHALYKGALFLLAGAVDHEAGTRDLNELRGLRRVMPITAGLALISALSMAGVAPLLGFIAKEEFLTAAWHAPQAAEWLTALCVLASVLLVAGAGLSGVLPFVGPRSSACDRAHDPPFSMWFGPLVLTAGSLAVGFFPQTFATPLLEPAVSSIRQAPLQMKLKLWHGWNVPFVLSLTALVLGTGVYVLRTRVWKNISTRGVPQNLGPEAAYRGIMKGLISLAAWQTRLLQNGSLRIHVLTIIASTITLVGLVFPRLDISLPAVSPLGFRFHELAASLFIVIGTIIVVRSQSRFRAITALGSVGLNIAWLFNAFGAPDLAMTQLVVESLIVLVFVLSFPHLPTYSILSPTRNRFRDAALAIGIGAAVTVLLLAVDGSPHIESISDYYVRESVPQGHGRNVVNVILVDFRALDTLGEITVMATASIGVFALVRLVLPKGNTR